MVVVNVDVEGDPLNLYMDGVLYERLTKKVKKSVNKKDRDYVMVVDGEEGSGKSVLAFQIAKVLDPNFNLKQVAFTSEEFRKLIINANRFQAIVFDEAFTGLSSRSALSETNQLLVQLMMEMRQRNLFVILAMPTFFMLDRYAVLHRAKCLFHVYYREDNRGYWRLYNKKKMKYLYIKGKQYLEYNSDHSWYGRFREQYTLNEQVYRDLKKKAFKSKKRSTRAEIYKNQRDTLFYIMIKDLAQTQLGTSNLCRKYGYRVDRSNISLILEEKNRQLLKES